MSQKSFFQERTAAEIKKLGLTQVKDLKELIALTDIFKPHGSVQITNNILPRNTRPVPFMKYGPVTRLSIPDTVEECMEADTHPYKLIREAVAKMTEPTLGYGFLPPSTYQGKPLHTNLKPRVVPWKEVLEGHRVFAYSQQEENAIGVSGIFGRDIVNKGRVILGQISSRRHKVDRHNISLHNVPGVPLKESTPSVVRQKQFYIPWTIEPTDDSEKRRYLMIRTGMPGLELESTLPIVWLDIALYDEIIRRDTIVRNEFLAAHKREKRFWPSSLELTPFPMLTQLGADIYIGLRNSTINWKGEKLNDAETNLAFGAFVQHYGYDPLFFAPATLAGKVANIHWQIN